MMVRSNSSKRVLLFNVFPVWRGKKLDMRMPLGMLYLGSSLKKHGYSVEAYHITEGEIHNVISELNFDEVLFVAVTSIMTGYSLRSATQFSQHLKTLYPDLPIAWGGVMPSEIPEVCLCEDFVDVVGIGEGEDLIVDIAKMYDGLVKPQDIMGLGYKDEHGKIYVNPRRGYIQDLDRYEPDYSLIDLNDYIFGGYITGLIMSSRGCPYDCAFCYNNSFNHRRWRRHSAEYVQNILSKLKKTYDFWGFSFSDDNFFVDNKRAITLIEAAYKLGLRVGSVDIKINNITEDDIKKMGSCEVLSVFFGTESLNPRLIKLINKQQSKELVVETIKRFEKYAPNVSVQTEILMALPFETMKELRQDIKDGLDLYKHHHWLSVYFGVLFPLPNTTMMKYAEERGFKPQKLRDYSQIDLNNAWSICDQWFPEITLKGKRKLYLTEKYSALISYNRSKHMGLWYFIVVNFLFYVSRFRLKFWFFFLFELDFLIARKYKLLSEDFKV